MDSESSDQASNPRSRWLRGCVTFVVLSLLIVIVACVLGYTGVRRGSIRAAREEQGSSRAAKTYGL